MVAEDFEHTEGAAQRSFRWFVVHTLANREFGAAIQLRRQEFRTFVPAHLKTLRHARRFRTVKVAFFPRYLFVRLDLERDRWRSVNGTLGVAGLLMAGERPMPVPCGVVEQLQANADEDGFLAAKAPFGVGTTVRVATGPLAGFVGELVALDSGNRVRVLLEILGRKPVRLDRSALVSAA